MSDEHGPGDHRTASPSAPRQGRESWHLSGWLALYSVAGVVAWKLFTAILSDGRSEGGNLFGLVGLVLSGQIWA